MRGSANRRRWNARGWLGADRWSGHRAGRIAAGQAPRAEQAEFISAGQPLRDLVRQFRTHVMDREIGVGVNRLIGERRKGTVTSPQRNGKARGTAHGDELVVPCKTAPSMGPRSGGARNRMKLAKLLMSSNTALSTRPPRLKTSLGAALGEQFLVSSRSVLNRRFEMPISTL